MRSRAFGPLLLMLLTACATTIEPSASSVAVTSTTSPFVPAADRAALLDQFGTELSALSERIIDNDGQRDALARIEAIWRVLRVDLESDQADLVEGFEGVVELARSAVTRRRPADADKARLNATVLLTTASADES